MRGIGRCRHDEGENRRSRARNDRRALLLGNGCDARPRLVQRVWLDDEPRPVRDRRAARRGRARRAGRGHDRPAHDLHLLCPAARPRSPPRRPADRAARRSAHRRLRRPRRLAQAPHLRRPLCDPGLRRRPRRPAAAHDARLHHARDLARRAPRLRDQHRRPRAGLPRPRRPEPGPAARRGDRRRDRRGTDRGAGAGAARARISAGAGARTGVDRLAPRGDRPPARDAHAPRDGALGRARVGADRRAHLARRTGLRSRRRSPPSTRGFSAGRSRPGSSWSTSTGSSP